MRLQAAWLPGARLHLQDGPIDLVISAAGRGAAAAYRAASTRMTTMLDELCAELPLLRSARPDPAAGQVAACMQRAVRPFQAECFITPMAAVAGAVADAVLQAMTPALGEVERIIVNNGGDIALHLAPGAHVAAGMAGAPEGLFGAARISYRDPVRGIATSGFGGRSDTLGIADAVTVLAARAAEADAAATMVANAVDLPGHAAIVRGPSRRPQSDLAGHAVTLEVGFLAPAEITAALGRGAAVARLLQARGLLHAAALHLRGQTLVVDAVPQRLRG